MRLVGATLAATAIPALRSERAQARLMACPGDGPDCSKEFAAKFKCKCPHPTQAGCFSYRCCSSADECFCDDEVDNKGANCCRKPWTRTVIEEGAPGEGPLATCAQCPAARTCGQSCCKTGEVCKNKARSLCCVAAWQGCGGDRMNPIKCCPPNDECCAKGSTVNCCSRQKQTCDRETGRCKCKKKGAVPCGDDCCDKKETCSSWTAPGGKVNKKCCPKGKINCGGTCCDAKVCCGGSCCKAGETCCGKRCCKPEKCCNAAGTKICCQGEDTCVGQGSAQLCCPWTRHLKQVKKCCPPGTHTNPPATRECCTAEDPFCDGCADSPSPLVASLCVDGRWVPI